MTEDWESVNWKIKAELTNVCLEWYYLLGKALGSLFYVFPWGGQEENSDTLYHVVELTSLDFKLT